MVYKFKTFKSITKGLMGPNIIFPAAYILFSAKSCPGFSSNVPIARVSSLLSSEAKQTHALEDLNKVQEVQGDTLDVTALSGRATLLNLDGYQCGVFVASETKEAFIIKLPAEGGWMQLVAQLQKGASDAQAGLLPICYDAALDPRIIKIDHPLLEQLLQPTDPSSDIAQCSMDKEAFWHKIEKDHTWRDIAFCYGKKSISDHPIFKEAGITSSTPFTKERFQKFSSTNRLISSNLLVKGNLPSGTLLDFEKMGFVLVKDKCVLGKLVKDMLESGSEWGTKAVEDYRICPAELDGNILQFDSSKLQEAHTSVPLEDYNTTYYYIKDGEYDRLIALENVQSSVKLDKETYVLNRYYSEPVVQVPEENTTEAPLEQPVDKTVNPNELPPPPGWLLDTVDGDSKSNTESEATIDEQPKDEAKSEISNNGETNNANNKQTIPNAPPTKSVITTPMQYTGPNAGSVPPPPPPPPPLPLLNTRTGNNQVNQHFAIDNALLEQIREGKKLKKSDENHQNQNAPSTGHGNTTSLVRTASNHEPLASSMPNRNGAATPPPPPPPPPPISSPLPLIVISKEDGNYRAKTDNAQKSSGGSMMDELKGKLNQIKQNQESQKQSAEQLSHQTIDEKIIERKITAASKSNNRATGMSSMFQNISNKIPEPSDVNNKNNAEVNTEASSTSCWNKSLKETLFKRNQAMDGPSESEDSGDSDNDFSD